MHKYSVDGFDIVFDHVFFAYNNDKPVLSDVSFTAKQGEITCTFSGYILGVENLPLQNWLHVFGMFQEAELLWAERILKR